MPINRIPRMLFDYNLKGWGDREITATKQMDGSIFLVRKSEQANMPNPYSWRWWWLSNTTLLLVIQIPRFLQMPTLYFKFVFSVSQSKLVWKPVFPISAMTVYVGSDHTPLRYITSSLCNATTCGCAVGGQGTVELSFKHRISYPLHSLLKFLKL